MSELSSKEWRVYNLLKSQPNHWFSCEEIKAEVPEIIISDDERNPSPELTEMRIKLNESPVIDKIIITKKHCFKIATLEEYLEERARHIRRIESEVAQVKAQDLKYERNGQGKLFNNVLNELKPENEQFHETFIEAPKLEKAKSKTRVFVDLENYKAYIVKNVSEYTLNEETLIAYIYTDQTEIELLNIHEVIDEEQLARPFYENYERVEY